MKTKFKNYEILIALFIIANVIIFSFFSRKLESFVFNYTVDMQNGNF